MQSSSQPHRQCVDCYYRVKGRCLARDGAPTRQQHEDEDYCAHFLRASLRFAFFANF